MMLLVTQHRDMIAGVGISKHFSIHCVDSIPIFLIFFSKNPLNSFLH